MSTATLSPITYRGTPRLPKNTVTTWADDEGVQYATVELGIPVPLEFVPDHVRNTGRRAIRRSKVCAGHPREEPVFVDVEQTLMDSDELVLSITYVEI